MQTETVVLFVLASACALCLGFSIGRFLLQHMHELQYRKAIHEKSRDEDHLVDHASEKCSFLATVAIKLMMRIEKSGKSNGLSKRLPSFGDSKSKEMTSMIRLSGLSAHISPESVREAKVTMALGGLAIGALVGLVFSIEMAFVASIVAAAIGSQIPKRALKGVIAKRTYQCERHLSEMLDVFVLCMRSGLSIDSSISIYVSHFDTLLSSDMKVAWRKWSSGLERRDEALKGLAATYDSAILSRVIDTMIRSARYGASMISSLESDSEEARGAFRALREERIAKAPVKMMIPTGVLILPAMLIMVLGPVLLELMEGGI